VAVSETSAFHNSIHMRSHRIEVGNRCYHTVQVHTEFITRGHYDAKKLRDDVAKMADAQRKSRPATNNSTVP